MIKEYKYYYGLRPPGPGCQPRSSKEINFEEVEVNGKYYWGYVIYTRKLTELEKFTYDLVEEE